MKPKLLLSTLLSFSFYLLSSQVPQGFNYQAIARDGSGNPIVGATIKVKLSILTDTAGFRAGTGGTYLWEEEHLNVLTNAYGLFNIVLGDPLALKTDGTAASFSLINWSLTDLYLGTKIANPTTYKVLGAAKLWSVPYSLLAKNTETKQTLSLAALDLSISGGNTVSLPAGSTAWTVNGADLYRQSGNVGIGTNNPLALFHVTGNTRLNNSMMGDGIELQTYASGNRYSGIDFHGDDTYTDYALRILRYNTGPNAGSSITHRGLGELNLATQDAAPISFYTTNLLRMTIRADGNVGVGTASPTAKLEIRGTTRGVTTNGAIAHSGQFQAMTDNSGQGLRAVYSFYPTFESTPTDNVGRRAADIVGGYNGGAWGKEYMSFNVGNNGAANDAGNLTSEKMRITSSGFVGIGTTNPTSKMVIQPPATWDDNVPLFEVKNKYGTSVLAVYNNGVRILVGHDPVKGITKGGFAIGGFDNTKAMGETVNLMTVTPDSVRFNIDNGDTKGITKGGFAIGSFDQVKGLVINPKEFMNMTPSSSKNGQYNTFVGYQAGVKNTTGAMNTFVGYISGANNTSGYYNSFFGDSTGFSNTTGMDNTFIGGKAGYKNTTGLYNVFIGAMAGYSNTTGHFNTANGTKALNSNTYGYYNTAIGFRALTSNTTGGSNTAVGMDALYYNTTGGSNTATGASALQKNTTGVNNTALGGAALYSNSTGSENTATGKVALQANTTGFSNTANGEQALYNNTTGYYNTAVGFGALSVNTTGGQNTALGYGAGVSAIALYNTTAIGYQATANANNKIVLGNASATTVGGYGAWTNYSDRRLKENIQYRNDLGLNFIMKLRTASFSYKDDVNKHRRDGFIAQDVQQVLKDLNIEFSGLVIDDDEDQTLNLSYGEFVIPLINAVKEQQIQIESTKEENQLLKSQLQSLQEKMDRIEAMVLKGGVK